MYVNRPGESRKNPSTSTPCKAIEWSPLYLPRHLRDPNYQVGSRDCPPCPGPLKRQLSVLTLIVTQISLPGIDKSHMEVCSSSAARQALELFHHQAG